MTNGLLDAVKKAAIAGDVSALIQLVATHGGPTVRMDDNAEELTALHWASTSGSVEAIKFLLAAPVDADPCAARMNNFTPLHSAAMQGHAKVCEMLLAAGAGVNIQTEPQGYTPLHSAAFAGHVEAVKVLLAHGANCRLVNYRNERPADTARRTCQNETSQLLDAHEVERNAALDSGGE